MALLKSLANMPAKDGPPGVLVEAGLDLSQPDQITKANPFRRDLKQAISNQSIWPWLILLGSCVFFADVFVRRVQINFEWLVLLLMRSRDWVLRRERAEPEPETMSRLQSRKREIKEQIEERRAATRFEEPVETADTSDASDAIAQASAAVPPQTRRPQPTDEPPEQAEGPSYTERLLKAKRQVWHDRDKDSDNKK